MRPCVEAERQRGAEGERRILAPVIIQRGVAHLDRAIRHGIEHLQARHDFAGGERLNLEFVVGDLGHAFGEILAAAVQRIERLWPTRRISPLHFRHRLRDRRRGNRCARGETDATCFQEITTFHALPSVVPRPRRGTRSLCRFYFADSQLCLLSETRHPKTALGLQAAEPWKFQTGGRMTNRFPGIKGPSRVHQGRRPKRRCEGKG
jgi:hypothetical protein